MKIQRNQIYVCLFLLLIVACAPTRIVKPLAKGEQMVSVNLGGPLLKFAGAPIPIPLTSLAYARGVNDKTTVFGSLHTTSLLFGVFQTDIGICQQLYQNTAYKFGISANPVINFALDRWEWNTKLWPQLDLNLHKEFGTKYMLYAGVANWFELNKVRPHNEVQKQFVFVNPHLGFYYSPKKWSYGLEAKYLMGGTKNTPNVADFIGMNGFGAIGIYFNFIK